MTDKVGQCLAHLEAAETILVAANDHASLARLALVIDLLRRSHGMPDRPLDLAGFDAPVP